MIFTDIMTYVCARGKLKIFTGQVKYFLTCPEKCISYIELIKELQHLVAVLYRTSRSNSDLSVPDFFSYSSPILVS